MDGQTIKKSSKIAAFLAVILAILLAKWALKHYISTNVSLSLALVSTIVVFLIGFVVAFVPLYLIVGVIITIIAPTTTHQSGPRIIPAPDAPESLLALKNYVVLDTETTGVDRYSDQMVEIAILTVSNGKVTDEYATLIHPTIPIPAAATEVNGITNADLASAPHLADVVPEISRRIDGQIIVGHNITFDLAFVSRALANLDGIQDFMYIDTLSLARSYVPGKSHRLQALASRLRLQAGTAHRALGDVYTTNELLQYCIKKATMSSSDFEKYDKARKAHQKEVRAAEFAWSPLYDKNFVFTGDFSDDRDQLEDLLESVGANLREKVNTKTVYLIVGDTSHLPEWAIERKYSKAQALIESGQHITILNEQQYKNLINDTVSLKQ